MKLFINTLLAVVMVMIAGNVSAETAEAPKFNRTVFSTTTTNAPGHHFVVMPEHQPINEDEYMEAIRKYVKGYFYGGKEGRDAVLSQYHAFYNLERNIEKYKYFEYDAGYLNPVQEFEYDAGDGKIGLKDSITPDMVIYILTVLNANKNCGKDEVLPQGDSINTMYFEDDAFPNWKMRLPKLDEKGRVICGVPAHTESCGNNYDRKESDIDPPQPNLDPSRKSFSIDTLGNNITINLKLENIGNSTSSVTNSGNSNGAGGVADEGSFREVDPQYLRDRGYQLPGNIPYQGCYVYHDPYGYTDYFCYDGNDWLYAAGGFVAGYLVGTLQYLYGQCHQNHASGCGYGYNSGGNIVINNYNINNTVVNVTNPSPGPRPHPTIDNPVDPSTENTASGSPADPEDRNPHGQAPRGNTMASSSTATLHNSSVQQPRGNTTYQQQNVSTSSSANVQTSTHAPHASTTAQHPRGTSSTQTSQSSSVVHQQQSTAPPKPKVSTSQVHMGAQNHPPAAPRGRATVGQPR